MAASRNGQLSLISTLTNSSAKNIEVSLVCKHYSQSCPLEDIKRIEIGQFPVLAVIQFQI